LSTSLSGLTRLSLDVKVDEEKDRKEGPKKNGKVGTELNLKSNSAGGKGLNNGVKSKCRGSDSRNR